MPSRACAVPHFQTPTHLGSPPHVTLPYADAQHPALAQVRRGPRCRWPAVLFWSLYAVVFFYSQAVADSFLDRKFKAAKMANVKDLFSLEGQTALVTGGTRGIGQAMAIALAEAGADILLVQVHAHDPHFPPCLPSRPS